MIKIRKIKTSSKVSAIHQPDYILALIVFGLIAFGLAMIYSASSVLSFEITNEKSTTYFLVRQLSALVLGLFLFFICQAINYKFWKKFALIFMLITIALLVIPAFPKIFGSLAHGFGGAYRWIKLGFITFQPSEIVKLAFIIYLAAWFDKRQYELRSFFGSFIPFVIILGVVFFLILRQPDLGTGSIIVFIAASMFFVSGASLTYIFIGSVIASVVFWELIKQAPYRLARLKVFLNPSDILGQAYHINQALLAIGSGGLWGRGFGQSIQKHLYLPQPATDSIFAIICEELGFIRALFIPLLFIIFAWLGFNIVAKAPDFFGRMLATGIVAWIIFQAIINIGTMLAIFPLTGVPMPFISYGGSSLVATLAAIGILLNISKQTI